MNDRLPIRAACTIVSRNYIAYARVLARSFAAHHPDIPFYVCLVDRNLGAIDASAEPFALIEVESLGIPGFRSASFRFDIMELNTNVKPAFLHHLLTVRGHGQVVYLDPDIQVFAPLTPIWERLGSVGIVVTPHILTPITDARRPAESDHLWTGVFNLGFIGVASGPETLRFLDWWGERCLQLGYNDARSGVFVDQKWINLVPCLFESWGVLRHPGCNMAYWNLHERRLALRDGRWWVNDDQPLIFFHFSGFTHGDLDAISRHQDRATLTLRPDLRPLFEEYRQRLLDQGYATTSATPYAFGQYADGRLIAPLARRVFAVMADRFADDDPFDPASPFCQWGRRRGLLHSAGGVKHFNSRTTDHDDWRLRMIRAGMRLALRVLGPDRYWHLMRYLSFISIIRHQRQVLDP